MHLTTDPVYLAVDCGSTPGHLACMAGPDTQADTHAACLVRMGI